jgi:hypothetical protein
LQDSVLKAILELIDGDKAAGLTPRFRRSSTDPYVLIGIGSDSAEFAESISIRRKLTLRPEIETALRALPWRQFEYLCAYLLRRFGLRADVTRGTQEGGIDVYGVSAFRPGGTGGLGSRTAFRVIGQAKSIDVLIEPKVHEFADQCRDFISGVGRAFDALPSWFLEQSWPVVMVVFCSGRFTQEAERLATRKGIVTVNGAQLAEDICWNGEEDWFEQTGTVVRFLAHKFMKYFEERSED